MNLNYVVQIVVVLLTSKGLQYVLGNADELKCETATLHKKKPIPNNCNGYLQCQWKSLEEYEFVEVKCDAGKFFEDDDQSCISSTGVELDENRCKKKVVKPKTKSLEFNFKPFELSDFNKGISITESPKAYASEGPIGGIKPLKKLTEIKSDPEPQSAKPLGRSFPAAKKKPIEFNDFGVFKPFEVSDFNKGLSTAKEDLEKTLNKTHSSAPPSNATTGISKTTRIPLKKLYHVPLVRIYGEKFQH